VSPLVAYLAHEQCSANEHIYSVAVGRIARTFVAETRGVVLPEAIGASLSRTDQLDLEELHQPSSLEDEMTIIAKALAQAS
jgi:hypothetical protein